MIDQSYSFSFHKRPEGRPVTAQEAEQILIAALNEGETWDKLWEVARFYSTVGRQDVALTYLERLASLNPGSEDQAKCFLAMGQLQEQRSDFEAALKFYRAAFQFEPANNGTWYLINNNLGYCLNHFGRHEDAEPYCRAATRIDPARCNAFKNLGLSLEGQGRCAEAAQCFVQAVRADAADGRALRHLETLLEVHRVEVSFVVPEIDELLAFCREAVLAARRVGDSFA